MRPAQTPYKCPELQRDSAELMYEIEPAHQESLLHQRLVVLHWDVAVEGTDELDRGASDGVWSARIAYRVNV